jgi:hypothetical protein
MFAYTIYVIVSPVSPRTRRRGDDLASPERGVTSARVEPTMR